jgi:organic radical activating enzyme
MADVKMGNTCNHACVMCNPDDSSLIYNDWIKRKDSEFVKEYLDIDPKYFETVKFNGYKNKKYRDYINDVLSNNKKLKYLKILGGEPFLDNELISTLKNIDKKVKENLKLHFVTNGSIDIVSVLEHIGKFEYIKINVSVEGVGSVHEYARAGSTWKFVEENILKTIKKNICDVSIHHSLQTATILGFESLLKWCQQHSVKINCAMVEKPEYLSISALPTKLKDEIVEKINPYHSNFSNDVDVESGTLPYKNLIMKIKNIKYDPVLNDRFFKYVEWYQANKKIPKLQTLFPQLYNQHND